MSTSRFWGLFAAFLVSMFFAHPLFADVYAPDPSMSPEDAFNTILGANSWRDIAFLIKGLAAAISLIFTAWALTGIYDASLVKAQITNKEAVILAVRLLVILSVFIVLLNL